MIEVLNLNKYNLFDNGVSEGTVIITLLTSNEMKSVDSQCKKEGVSGVKINARKNHSLREPSI